MFAAGFGTRMRPLTLDRPKPLVKVAGQTLLDHTLHLAREVNPQKIVVNTHYKAQMIEEHLDNQDVVTLREHPDILETGGGLRHALPLLGDGPIVTTNTDAIWKGPNPFECLLQHWDPDRMEALLLCVPLSQTIGRAGGGDFTLRADGQLDRRGDEVFGGIQILKPHWLHKVDEQVFSLNKVWNLIRQNNQLFGARYPGRWCDIGTPDGIALAEDMLAHD